MAASPARIAEVLAGLRASSARLRSAAALDRAYLPLGIDAIDEALGGGLLRGRLTELVGPRGSGRLSLTLGALASAQARSEWVALIDAADALDVRSAAAAGLVLERLLWVRARGLVESLQAADRVLDAGGFGLVAIYAVEVPRAGPAPRGREAAGSSAFSRLVHRAERARAAVLLVAERPLAGSFSVATLALERAHAAWVGQGAGKILDGACGQVRVARSKVGLPGEAAEVALAAGASARRK